ncbi:MAG: DUF309 domain-containing protein [Gemmatimonadetes bacterium]|nr:DUF309 domain-containing protein [Gemmatimonadota bacterium]
MCPPALADFVALFNAQRFWESHEALEDAWRRTRSEFYHGLILYASAWVHLQRRNPHGMAIQLGKAERSLAEYRPAYLGIDVDALLENARRVRERVRPPGHGRPRYPPEGIAYPRLALDPARVRGDEPELAGAAS